MAEIFNVIVGVFATIGAFGFVVTVGVVLYIILDFKRNDDYEEGYVGVGNGINELKTYKKNKSHLKVVK